MLRVVMNEFVIFLMSITCISSYRFKTANEPNAKYDPTPKNNWFNFRSNIDVKINDYLGGFMRLSGNIKTEKRQDMENETIYNHIF